MTLPPFNTLDPGPQTLSPGAKPTLYTHNAEADLLGPIVSVSLGLPATFLWGGPSRMTYHSVKPLKDGHQWRALEPDVSHGACALWAG